MAADVPTDESWLKQAEEKMRGGATRMRQVDAALRRSTELGRIGESLRVFRATFSGWASEGAVVMGKRSRWRRLVVAEKHVRRYAGYSASYAFASVPALPGVYVVYYRGVVVYVGSTETIRGRMQAHFLNGGLFKILLDTLDGDAEFVVKFRLSAKAGDWLMQEYRLIKRIFPLLNIRSKGNRK